MDLPPDRPAGRKISFTYSYDGNQLMQCIFEDIESGKKINVELNITSKENIDELDSEIEKFMVE